MISITIRMGDTLTIDAMGVGGTIRLEPVEGDRKRVVIKLDHELVNIRRANAQHRGVRPVRRDPQR